VKIIDTPSPNHGERRDSAAVDMLVLHYTGTRSREETFGYLLSPEKAVSSHYFVDTDGAVHRLVAEDRRAWHAGQSYWAGEEDINSRSIGIEIQNTGHDFGLVPFPDIQIEAVKNLCLGILSRHSIPPERVLAHSDIAPLRKKDPGELFPWEELAKAGIGLWPGSALPGGQEPSPQDIRPFLIQYGYDPRLDTETLITAFQRHFEPDVFKIPLGPGVANLNTVHILRSILQNSPEIA
jgi:N-acetylmuramoyl-L-alanine amidase